jgi:RNA recognition motif-containing protein
MMRVFFQNLPFSTSELDLRSLLGRYGEVRDVEVVKDRFSGQSKGYAFATFDDDAAAFQAIDGLNNSMFEGRELHVAPAKPLAKARSRQ